MSSGVARRARQELIRCGARGKAGDRGNRTCPWGQGHRCHPPPFHDAVYNEHILQLLLSMGNSSTMASESTTEHTRTARKPVPASLPVDNNKKYGTSSFLTPDELALLLKVSKTTVYRLVEARRVPFYRVAGSLRFSTEDVESYLKRNRVTPITNTPYVSTKD